MSDIKYAGIDYGSYVGTRQGSIVFISHRTKWKTVFWAGGKKRVNVHYFTIQCDCGNTKEIIARNRDMLTELKTCGVLCPNRVRGYYVRQRGELIFRLNKEEAVIVLQYFAQIRQFAKNPENHTLPFMVLRGNNRPLMVLPDGIVIPHRIAVELSRRGENSIIEHFRRGDKNFFLEK